MIKNLKLKIKNLPNKPGVYLMKDLAGRIIYVGKAKDTRKRVSSYFQKTDVGPKIQALIPNIRCIDYIIASSEREAFIIEEHLIKKHKPVFNSMWKDDKSYPYVVLTKSDDFPRLYLSRKKHIPPGAMTFGPYPAGGKIKALIRMLFRKGILPLRPCHWNFSKEKPLDEKTISSCLYYHTGQCLAPCAVKISRKNYSLTVKRAEMLMGGKIRSLRSSLVKFMKIASKKLRFEEAARFKEYIEALDHIGEHVIFREVNKEDLMFHYMPKSAISDLKDALKLKQVPKHIEAFDISNLHGTLPTASTVCFLDGKPNKAHYRHMKMVQTKGIDDFAMMKEVAKRRLGSIVRNKEKLPDLIMADGGLGQLKSIMDACQELGMTYKIDKCALAKNEELIFKEKNNTPIRLEKTRPALKLLMHIRDEAHRFAINYHKKLRRRELLKK
ncbi:GIY-YIG nuclease family protein [Elusimicrobiota bacterium]